MPIWSDFFKLFTQATEADPLAKFKDKQNFPSAGVSQLGLAGSEGSNVSLRETTEMIDTTSLNNRTMRYKEYERLRNIPEIESAMTIFSDEACVAGDTNIATPFGFVTIEELAEKRADDRFLVYCYDFTKNDYTLGWAYAPRLVKEEETITILLDNGKKFTCTADHRVLLKNGQWTEAGKLKFSDELMPFYRLPANTNFTKRKHNQYPRLYSHNKGWIHERQFVDDWKSGKTTPEYEKVNKTIRMIGSGLKVYQMQEQAKHDWDTLEAWMGKEGFSKKEVQMLYKNKNFRRIIGVLPGPKQKVYDISVDTHKCFATDSVILHNCQKDDKGNILKVEAANDEIREEVEFLLLHRKMLNMNRHGWTWFKNTCIMGDWFVEVVVNPENPSEGIYKTIPLPPETMFRIETVKGKLLEFQQSKDGPDYQSIIKGPIQDQNEMELKQTTSIRFNPNQIVHFRFGDDRKTFYPYGQSLIEPCRGPAHNLRLLEDAMVTYRLARAAERRIFYIDVGQLPPYKAEVFLDRLKDQFRKRKVASNRNAPGANSIDEKWQPPAVDEDYWLPIRPNSQTRIDTLPGAENLGEIDDAIYFRNKLLTALHIPKNYLNNEDVSVTRITLSAQDFRFARMIERLQSHFEDGLFEIAERHLQLRGFPEESYQDLKIKMTPPSDYRELSKAEVWTSRYGNAGTLKSSQLMADYDIMIDILKIPKNDADEKLSRLKLQKLEDLKLQVLAQNPALLGVGIPGQEQSGQEIGSEAGGPNPMLAPGQDPNQPPIDPNAQPQPNISAADDTPPLDPKGPPPEGTNIPEPNEEDIKKFDLEIEDYESEQDRQDIDFSIGD